MESASIKDYCNNQFLNKKGYSNNLLLIIVVIPLSIILFCDNFQLINDYINLLYTFRLHHLWEKRLVSSPNGPFRKAFTLSHSHKRLIENGLQLKARLQAVS